MDGREYFTSTLVRDSRFGSLQGIAKFENEDAIYVADERNACIWRIDIESTEIACYAGEPGCRGCEFGPKESARFESIAGLATHGSCLYVADDNKIEAIDSTDGVVSYEESLSGLVEGLAVMCAGDLTAVMATASSIYLLRISDSRGCLHRMPERDFSSSWGRLLERGFEAAGQMAYGVKSESFYVAHKRGVTKIREVDDVEIRTPSAYGLAIDEKENVYFASYDGLAIFKAGGSLFSITETVCKGLDGVRHLFYDSQSGLLYFTEKKAVRTVQVKTPFVLLDARLRKDLGRLIDSDDIPVQDQATFLVEGKRIRVSKTILCLRSEYFKTMFQSGFAESQANASPISISDTTYDAFYALVVFIVTGRFVVKDSSKYLLDALTLSDRYLVEYLKLHCSKMLVDFAGDNLEMLLDYACLAERHGFQELFDACLDSIVPQLKYAYRLEAFKNLSKEALLEVISQSIEKN